MAQNILAQQSMLDILQHFPAIPFLIFYMQLYIYKTGHSTTNFDWEKRQKEEEEGIREIVKILIGLA